VLAEKRWEQSLKRFKTLKERLGTAIEDRLEHDLRLTKTILKCAKRLLDEASP